MADLADLVRAAAEDAARVDELLDTLAAALLHLPVLADDDVADARSPLRLRHDEVVLVPVFVDEDELAHALPDGQRYVAVRGAAMGRAWDDETWVTLHAGSVGLWLSPAQVRALAERG